MRQINVLADEYDLTVIGFGPAPADQRIKYFTVDSSLPQSLHRKLRWASQLLSRRFEQFYSQLPWVIETKHILDQIKPNAIIANDVDALPISIYAEVPVLCDAHEYAPRQFEDRLRWRIFFQKYKDYICRAYLPKVAGMTTVCEGISQEYRKRYNVSSRIVHNTPAWQRPEFKSTSGGRINLIHHGIANKSRHLELMIEMMDHLDSRFYLDLMLVGDDFNLSALRNRAHRNHRINIIPPVPMADICKKLSGYDIGVFLLRPVNFNYTHALPNKFFEFIQAGLAVAIGPSVEMRHIVDKYKLGVISETFEPKALAERINALSASDIDRLKKCSIAASEELGFETDAQIIRQEVYKMFEV